MLLRQHPRGQQVWRVALQHRHHRLRQYRAVIQRWRDLMNRGPGDSAARVNRSLVRVLAGFMRILTVGFVSRYEGRLINIHPSLLPAFSAPNGVRVALSFAASWGGTAQIPSPAASSPQSAVILSARRYFILCLPLLKRALDRERDKVPVPQRLVER